METKSIEQPRQEMENPTDNLNSTEHQQDGVLVSFVIPALNEERHIARCLGSIRRLALPTGVRGIEIVVVDNQSTDRTAQLSREHGALVVEVPPKNPSRARNAGARAANGDWLAFVDADCTLAADWLVVCGGHLANDAQIVAAAGVMRAPTADHTWVEKSVYEITHGQRIAEVCPVGWLPTFNLLVRRSTFEGAGGFDENLTTCEDCDLGYKLGTLGQQLLDYRTTAAHDGESRTLFELFRREAWRSRGNLHLALARPLDVRNWLSLLLPLFIVFGFGMSLFGLMSTAAIVASAWPWFVATAMFPVAVIAIALKKAGLSNWSSLARQTIVLATYFAGRAAGLFWSFRRVTR